MRVYKPREVWFVCLFAQYSALADLGVFLVLTADVSASFSTLSLTVQVSTGVFQKIRWYSCRGVCCYCS